MPYIDEIIANIERNSGNISIKKVDELRFPFKVSISKFTRDFKKETGSTPRDYLIRMKIELANACKAKDPALTIKEVVLKVGWDLTERQFSELFKSFYGKTFGGKEINDRNISGRMQAASAFSMENKFMFSNERKQLEEIILRLVLLTGDYHIDDDGELCKTIRFEMENTCFRFPLFTFEKELIFRLFLNRNNYEQLDLFMVFTRFSNSNECFIPNDKSPYLDLIYNVANKQVESIKTDILESIMNWEELIEGEHGFIFSDYMGNRYNENVKTIVNKDAGIFKISQIHYNKIISEFLVEYENLLNSIQLTEEGLSNYISALEQEDEAMIESTLKNLLEINDGDVLPQKLDLLLRLAEYPEMEFVEFADYSFSLDEELLSKALQLGNKNILVTLVGDYYKVYKKKANCDENDDNYYGNMILSDLLEHYFKG